MGDIWRGLPEWARKLLLGMLAVQAVLIVLWLFFAGVVDNESLTGIFRPANDPSVPGWWGVVLLLSAAVGALAVWLSLRHTERPRAHWLVLGIGFVLGSVSEGAAVHERTGRAFSEIFGKDDDSLWVVLYSPLIVVGLWALWRVARDLRPALRMLGLAAFVLLVLAIMPDLIPPLIGWDAGAEDSTIRTLIEENLEFAGAACVTLTMLVAAAERLTAIGAVTWPPPGARPSVRREAATAERARARH
jgi:hypothetical protein